MLKKIVSQFIDKQARSQILYSFEHEMSTNLNKNGEIINSIDRALDISIILYYEQKELGVTEIAKSLELHKSTVHRTLSTLEDKGFVQQNQP